MEVTDEKGIYYFNYCIRYPGDAVVSKSWNANGNTI